MAPTEGRVSAAEPMYNYCYRKHVYRPDG